MLKSDFHMHSKEDIYDSHHVTYSARDIIDRAAKLKFEMLSITHHNHIFYNNAIRSYAKRKGIFLMPGTEAKIEGGHVLLINVKEEDLKKLKKVSDLSRIKDHALVVAAHPFYPFGNCLGDKVLENIKCFDAIEYAHLYARFMLNSKVSRVSLIQGNALAVKYAKKHKKPLVATSDAHRLYELGPSYTMVDCERSTESFVDAVKRGNVKMVSEPMPTLRFFRRVASLAAKEILLRKLMKTPHMPDVADEPYLYRRK